LVSRTDVEVDSTGDVGRARRLAAAAAERAGLPVDRVHRVALAVTELATNLVKHAGRGLVVVSGLPGALDVLSLDRGPGIRRLGDSMRDGFSTTGSMGGGLGTVRRSCDAFDIFPVPGKGTAVLARWRTRPEPAGPRVGAAMTTAPGETACGDQWLALTVGESLNVVVSDGLGHGEPAERASKAAVDVFAGAVGEGLGPARLLGVMQPVLLGTRGATVAVAQVTPSAGRLRFSGVGNVAGRLYPRPGARPSALLSRPGIVGGVRPRVVETTHEWHPSSWLTLHSDGVSERWQADAWPGLFDHDPALVAGWILAQHGRGRDDACVVAVSGSGAAGEGGG
jgi:anti-sigma regulatory factor (Ser/Thr protein kinase)